ncbi:MAG TPA: glycosyltransferase family 2 protein [Burkholderiaceae bacterium]|nr:glycosyltransferase family 2 protein [Burkholderiaceae bacterium]
MPTVSILIPAFRPEYLDVCIASALAQTLADTEIVVSDDSHGDDVARVVGKWEDPRIRYLRNPERGIHGANRDHLLRQARGKYVKFLFDDDYLMPRSVELLVKTAESTGARLAFHGRRFVDEAGRTLSSPLAVPAGQVAEITPERFYVEGVARVMNFIGEPSNVLFEAAALARFPLPFGAGGRPMRFLTDVALYRNFFEHGDRVVGLGFHGSAFRQHAGQTSARDNPFFPAGRYEWETLMRLAVDGGRLTPTQYASGMQLLAAEYRRHADRYPELAEFLELGGRPGTSAHYDGRFLELLDLADIRFAARRLPVAA